MEYQNSVTNRINMLFVFYFGRLLLASHDIFLLLSGVGKVKILKLLSFMNIMFMFLFSGSLV